MPAFSNSPRHPISDVLQSGTGTTIVSVIFGLGLAALFQRVCNGRCVVVQGPDRDELERYHYKIDGECFKYNVVDVSCPASKR